MVHVLELLGCIAQGPTTEAALEATPAAISSYMRFLRRHGEISELTDPFDFSVAEHVTEGVWLGNGDPTPGFTPDFQALTPSDLMVYLRRLAGLRDELLALTRALSQEQWLAEPTDGARPIARIMEHVVKAHAGYLHYLVGKVDGVSDLRKMAGQGPAAASLALSQLWDISLARLATLNEEERRKHIPHGQVTWTARRALRRMLEHAWEHRQEIAVRLGSADA